MVYNYIIYLYIFDQIIMNNAQNEWMIATVGDDNVLQMWQPTEAIYNEAKGDLLDLNLM